MAKQEAAKQAQHEPAELPQVTCSSFSKMLKAVIAQASKACAHSVCSEYFHAACRENLEPLAALATEHLSVTQHLRPALFTLLQPNP